MTNQEAREELADLADSLNISPSTRKGQAMQIALDALKEPKKGMWREVWQGYGIWLYKCSVCSHSFVTETNYCPECGIMMEVDDDVREPD